MTEVKFAIDVTEFVQACDEATAALGALVVLFACDLAFDRARGIPRQRALRMQLELRRNLRRETERLEREYPTKGKS
jgi:hypothetical protein